MEAREALARALLRSEVDVHSEDPWEETGEELHTAYLAAADERIEELQRVGLVIVHRTLLKQVLEALDLQPWRYGTEHARIDERRIKAEAKRTLRRALRLVYRCDTCGEWLAQEELDGGGHVVDAIGRDGNPTPQLCGPVRLVGEEVG